MQVLPSNDAGRDESLELELKIQTAKHQSRRWDGVVRGELRRFARQRFELQPWSAGFWDKLLPFHTFRTRKQVDATKVIWWVERDLQPYDRFRSAAFCVEVSFAGEDPSWTLRTGSAVYPIDQISQASLRSALAQALKDPPLLVHDEFGSALDP